MTNLHEISAEEFNSLNKGAHIYAARIDETYWRLEAERYAANTDYWRQKYNDLAEKVAVAPEAFCGFPDGAASSSNAGGSCVTAGETAPSHKITSDGVAVVAPSCHWIPIDKNTPTGKAMWLINKAANSAQKGVYLPGEKFFDHWFPFPTFKKQKETT